MRPLNNKHMEQVGLKYVKIGWSVTDGNVEFTDSWIESRQAARCDSAEPPWQREASRG